MYVCMYMYVCRTYRCAYVWVCMHICMCVYVCMLYVCMYACMCVCICVHVSMCVFTWACICIAGHGGAFVETMTFNRRVVGSTPALAATQGPWASPLPAVASGLRRETSKQYPCCSRERFWVVEDLKGRYRNGRNEWMKTVLIILLVKMGFRVTAPRDRHSQG